MRVLSLALVLLAAPAAAHAQVEDAAVGQVPQRVRSITLAAGQSCPKAEGDEIVVCRPAEDPYRIPKAFRHDGPIPVPQQSWVNRVADMDQVSRVAGGLPNTCSPIGTGGQTGCSMMWLKQWSAERRQQQREQESIP